MGKTEFIIEPGRQDIVMKRVFDAPRDVVFRAMLDPDLIPRWWGPSRYPTVVEEADVRPGGIWRYTSRDADGEEYRFKGVYHDIVPQERIVSTFEFEGMPGNVELDIASFEELDGKTLYTVVAVYPSVEGRDRMAQTGMEEGASETMDRLEALLKEL